MTTTILETYDMAHEAIGLADFVMDAAAGHGALRSRIYVVLPHGGIVTGAAFERETLSDGSHAFNLRLHAEE